MQKLTKENIQFIENYLENSDVFYADIRMEMTDHIASAIEDEMNDGDQREFYYIFKDYMVENKARLINDRNFIKSANKKVMRLLAKDLFTIKTLLVFLIVVLGFVTLFNNVDFELFKTTAYIPVFSIIPIAVIYYIMISIYKLNRFSVVERLAFPYIIIFQFVNIISLILKKQIDYGQNFYLLIGSLAIFVTLIYVLLKVSINVVLSYKKQFKNIA